MFASSPARSLAVCLALCLCASPARAETNSGGKLKTAAFDFVNQEYGDILYALSLWSGFTLTADDTVNGRATFRYRGAEFREAFSLFLKTENLYAQESGGAWTVSRMSLSRTDGGSEANGGSSSASGGDKDAECEWVLDASGVSAEKMLERISRESGRTIVWEVLPNRLLSIHARTQSVDELAALVIKPFPGWAAFDDGSALHIKQASLGEANPARESASGLYIEKKGSLYSVDIRQARLGEAVDRLSREEGNACVSLLKSDPMIASLRVEDRSWDEVFTLVAEQAGAEWIERDGIRYILPASQDAQKKIREGGWDWRVYTLTNVRPSGAKNLLAARFPNLRCEAAGDGGVILLQGESSALEEGERYLELVDRSQRSSLVVLKYISAEELFKSLPPSVKKEDLTDTGTGKSVFFTGPEGLKKTFLAELAEIDRPKTRLRYDLLIMQFESSSAVSWGTSAEMARMERGDASAVAGRFGNLLGLNFDVITLFGYTFSARLDAALSENRAKVYADTTLHGISGERVSFKNTTTYRYRDSNIDPETGKPMYSGVTREIVSGITVDISGWVSGDGMVTMTVAAAVSKRGADVASASSNPPPTSERNVTTKVNAADGEPVILSGLRQDDRNEGTAGVPIVSKIPILGSLLSQREKKREKTEMVMYIVPHVCAEDSEDDGEEGARELAATAYERIVAPRLVEAAYGRAER
ncbi:type II secretion system protein GspD [Teretinema zuelzerae]|uniref:type II secretion system protein GspD n=1 Tax=Teretinema zuelzerae TaxID=156 RepID=UPI001E36045D|nr:type II and III secretion system protein [Teretinema zuelzerae]